MIEKTVPLHELLASVPEDQRLVIQVEGAFPTSTSIPVGRLCHEAAKELLKYAGLEKPCHDPARNHDHA